MTSPGLTASQADCRSFGDRTTCSTMVVLPGCPVKELQDEDGGRSSQMGGSGQVVARRRRDTHVGPREELATRAGRSMARRQQLADEVLTHQAVDGGLDGGVVLEERLELRLGDAEEAAGGGGGDVGRG